ncbi:AbrB family transcriptional regulator [Enterococcus villorum]|uniref:AbrB family transcriptional regulator n=2 Tax=Enterococcus villorum TaxID=112904 RepID=A0A511J2W0_9ENTE|nr:AbrB family transcriptional regulator [Enterococcus villorum ATCC 700913]EOW76596.1 AbrB family transcriptional regulator [Enterococcus villorum ATCC 700913]GEL92284.1 AbrB family transcriptional regulator [Enterococcus villorum]
MLITKSRLQGNSVVITLPSDNGKKPSENQEYIVVYSEDGTITLVPKIEDPFSGGEEAEYYEKDEWKDLTPEGREILLRNEKIIQLFLSDFHSDYIFIFDAK